MTGGDPTLAVVSVGILTTVGLALSCELAWGWFRRAVAHASDAGTVDDG